jgi:hypothetical protein
VNAAQGSTQATAGPARWGWTRYLPVLLVSLAPYHFLRFYVGGADVLSQSLALLWAWSESALGSSSFMP